MQTARMDLDDVNGNAAHGVHVAAMAGSWVSLVYGFAGLRDDDGSIAFAPRLPAAWNRLAFRMLVTGTTLAVTITRHEVRYELLAGDELHIRHFGRPVTVAAGSPVTIGLDPALRAVIFDLDGVITDTAEHHYRAWTQLCADEQIPFDRELNERLKGVSRMESLDIILEHAGHTASLPDKVRLADRKNAYFRELIDAITPADLLPGIGDLLADLRARDVRTAIASMSHNVYDVVRHLGIEDMVDAIVDPPTLVKGKPDPEIFLAAAELLGVRFEDCVGIEDARAGIQAIKAARMVAVGVGADLPGCDWLVSDTRPLTFEALAALFPGSSASSSSRRRRWPRPPRPARTGRSPPGSAQPPAIAGRSRTVSVDWSGVASSWRCRTSVSFTNTFTNRLMPPVSSSRRGPRSGYAATRAVSASPTVAPSTSISFWPPADVRSTGGMRTWLMPTASLRTRRSARGSPASGRVARVRRAAPRSRTGPRRAS